LPRITANPARSASVRLAVAGLPLYERVQLRDLVVIKSPGERVRILTDQAGTPIRISDAEAPDYPERIDQMIPGNVRRLESLGDTDIPSNTRDGKPR
jgi:transcriptional regulator NrdR family protein